MNKKLKKCVIGGLVGLSLSGIVFSVFPRVEVYAEEKIENFRSDIYNSVNEKVTVSKNDLYLKFEEELKILSSESEVTKEKYFELVEKYDGAEKVVTYGEISPFRFINMSGFSEKFVWGGVNTLAFNRQGIENLRTYFGHCALLLTAGGAVNGFLYGGGPWGALIGAVGGTFMSGRFNEGAGFMRKWFDVGSNKGGVRITLTEAFPIDNIDSLNQAIIRRIP
ncbi:MULTISPECIES: hypothetical protein [unclassified Granulicatella]|uniref:hypothetical protein n=1 Tax=unclassified Granulicatella TaxID=2630493 RepID=UPI001072FBE1|nr:MULTISPECIES: hypothetical protein [unclassified Granulicatella]MBF0780321.1 hypothetical protein [Granulicatella sp. 19428wC4_WM01]TFU95548.1 hypothetical protein E4T68_04375 [Granulicatella sp. WM01]